MDIITKQIDLLSNPFMQRAIYAGIIVSILCAILGIFLTLRKKSYMSEGIAHASLSGISFALLVSVAPIPAAVAVACFMSIGITFIRKHSKIETDSLIGIFSSILFALGIIILNLSPKYQPEISTYLFGQILRVNWGDIIFAATTLAVVVFYISIFYEKILYATFDSQSAKIRGINTDLIEYVINILIAISIIASVKVVGVILATGLLVIPASSAKLLARSFKQMIPIALNHNIISVVLGIFLSSLINVPSGAMIVVVSGILFFLVFLFTKWNERSN